MIDLNDDNFLIFAIKNYDNPSCNGMSDLEEDLKRFKYIKRLFKRYENTDVLSERLVLNHLIVLYNVFGNAATTMLFYKIEQKYWSYLKTFLVFLNRMTDSSLIEVTLDQRIVKKLRELNV
jgi:hypothetical protein